jgi:hypothetical protein
MFTIIKMSSKFSDHFRSPRDLMFGYACCTWWILSSWTVCAPTRHLWMVVNTKL